jgi:hypothetical protein
MSKLMLLQAVYCLAGIMFFVRDIFAKVPMAIAMMHAFIWPYAQWMVIKAYALTTYAKGYDRVMTLLHR